VESLPDAPLLGERQSLTVITHPDAHALLLYLDFDAHLHRVSGGRVSEGIGQVVGHHLLDPTGISVDRQREIDRTP